MRGGWLSKNTKNKTFTGVVDAFIGSYIVFSLYMLLCFKVKVMKNILVTRMDVWNGQGICASVIYI